MREQLQFHTQTMIFIEGDEKLSSLSGHLNMSAIDAHAKDVVDNLYSN